jgi:Helix-turn-helix domain
MPLDDVLIEALRPAVKKMVEEEVGRARLQWRWLSVEQTAMVLGISEQAVRSRIRRGQLPVKHEHGRIWVDLDELARRLDEA